MFRPARWHRSTAGTDPERPIVPHPLRAAAAIVGAVDAVSPDGRLGRSDAQLEVEVIRGALEAASLTLAHVHCPKIGRASFRATRVPDVETQVVAVTLKKKK